MGLSLHGLSTGLFYPIIEWAIPGHMNAKTIIIWPTPGPMLKAQTSWTLRMQMLQFRIGTIGDQDQDPFLNNGSNFESKHVL